MSGATVQDAFLRFFDQYGQKYFVPDECRKVAAAIMKCKTGELGYNTTVCMDCGVAHTHYNSCRDRHCPACQSVPKLKWVDARKAEVVDGVPYFHAVFTIPEELNDIVSANQKQMYSLLHKCVSQTLLELSDDIKYLGARCGIIQVLHTWGSQLNYHPHIHAIIMGCGLAKNNKVVTSEKFFIPLPVLSGKFRGKFMDLMEKLYKGGELCFSDSRIAYLDSPDEWRHFTGNLYSKKWVPFIKETFNGSGNAIEYLGKYTHRIAISNYRIKKVTDSGVTFAYKDYRDDKQKELTISGVEFIRRFLMHVLPKGFVKIRSYGALSNRLKSGVLETICGALSVVRHTARLLGLGVAEILEKVYGIRLGRCPSCNSTNLLTTEYRFPMRC